MSKDDQVEEDEGDIDAQLTNLWRQFLLDITAKAPNKMHANDNLYCVLTLEQCQKVNEDTYKNKKLSNYFLDCQWKIADNGEWDAIFNRFFPLPPSQDGKQLAGKIQNYTSTWFYPAWTALRNKADEETVTCMHQVLKKKFHRLFWMPFAQSDQIWKTKYDSRFSKSSRVDPKTAAPLIILKGHGATWWHIVLSSLPYFTLNFNKFILFSFGPQPLWQGLRKLVLWSNNLSLEYSKVRRTSIFVNCECPIISCYLSLTEFNEPCKTQQYLLCHLWGF